MPAGDPILDVDLLAFERGSAAQRAAVVDGVRRSLATGFVYTSHDLPEGLLDVAYGILAEFFALAPEVKGRWAAPGTNGQRGYTGLLVETAAASDAPDWKEMLNWAPGLPVGHPLRTRYAERYPEPVFPEAEVPGIGKVLLEVHERLGALARRVLRIVAVGLGAAEDIFEWPTTGAPDLTRAIHYPPMALAPGPGHVWAAEHGDINLLTVLPRASASGLQVKTEDGWVDAAPPPGYAIVNTGIMLDRLSNGLIPTGIHRVVAEGSTTNRLSVVHFCHPTPRTILAPLPSCVGPDHPPRFLPVEADALFEQVLWEINLVEGARRV